MSDPILEEESLISQDDIDKLLDASSLEEAEEKLDTPVVKEDLEMDDFGELSQDDIDSLLSGDPPSAEDDDAGELSQDDIDSLLGGSDEPEADEGGELSQDDIDSLLGGGDDDDAGELSQNDIDSLLGGGGEDDDAELISQDDIDSLMSGARDEEDEEEDDDELISMDDIQNIIGVGESEADASGTEPFSEDAPEAVTSPEDPELAEEDEARNSPLSSEGGDADPLDEAIGEGDAVAVNDCLITQETMDELIRNAPDVRPAAAVPVAEDPIDLGGPVDLAAAEEPMDLGDDVLDNLLEESEESIDLDLGTEAAADVTQEDIDALLQESDDGDDFLDEDDDILISQDDIDTLLMAADQEDEDVLGDLLGDAVDDSMDDFDEQDVVSGGISEEEEADQVVLEGRAEEREEPDGEISERAEKIRRLLKSKLVLAAASVFLVLGISVPAVYFLFFSGKPIALPEKEVVPVAVVEPDRENSVASVSIEEEPAPVLRQSGTIVLTDFIILSSDLEKEMTYVIADISIDYSDQRAYHEISNNISFYRDLIYESIQTSLVSEKRKDVTEADLLWGVETSLKKVLPPRFIEKISFKTFRTS